MCNRALIFYVDDVSFLVLILSSICDLEEQKKKTVK